MGLDKEICAHCGVCMDIDDWIGYFDTLTIDEIQKLYWKEFNASGRLSLNDYLKKRLLNEK